MPQRGAGLESEECRVGSDPDGLPGELGFELRSEASAGRSHWIPRASVSRQGQRGDEGGDGRDQGVGSHQAELVRTGGRKPLDSSGCRDLSRQVAWSGW